MGHIISYLVCDTFIYFFVQIMQRLVYLKIKYKLKHACRLMIIYVKTLVRHG